jgi:hypothetical protein
MVKKKAKMRGQGTRMAIQLFCLMGQMPLHRFAITKFTGITTRKEPTLCAWEGKINRKRVVYFNAKFGPCFNSIQDGRVFGAYPLYSCKDVCFIRNPLISKNVVRFLRYV